MDSSQESFVVVSPHHPAHLPAHLARFFPSLNDSTSPPSLHDLAQRVDERRTRQPDHKLFIDHLVALALPDLDAAHRPSYPHDVASLVARLAAAGPSPVARSSLYYLALALSGADLARDLAHDLVLPVPFRLATRALFLVDSGQYALALRHLADPRVQADFVPRTLAVLASAPADPKDRAQLVLGYWRLARIRLDDYSSDECKHVLRALCAPERSRGVHEAWQLARTWPVEAERDQLAATILETCFGANHTDLPLSAHLSALMVVPFTASEDALATRFCAAPTAPLSLTLAVDWRLSKLVAEARPVDALRFYSRVRRDQGDKLAKSDARDRLLKAVEANLSDVQRSTLELDLSQPPAPAPTTSASSTAAAAAAPARQQVTHPAWAPSAAPAQQAQQQPAPSTPAAPPRTLAAARAAQRPAPPPHAPTADELPLSASPFVRSSAGTGAGAQGGLLRALEHAHTGMATPRKLAASAGGTGAPGSPFVQAVTPARTSALVAAEQQQQAQPSPRPTLAGFGSVRQVPLTTSALASPAPSRVAAGRTPARAPAATAAEEKDDEDDEMRSPTAQADDADEAPARDRAVQRTKTAGSGPGSAASPARRVAGVAGKGSEPTKRRAVARRPPHDSEVDAKRSSARTVVKQQPSRAAKPPGAFPSSSTASAAEEEEDDTQDEADDEPAPAPARRKQAAAVAQTPRRRSARASVAASSRAGTAEPASPPAAAAPTTTGRRATRATSATPSEPERGAQQTPVRRSSRLSGLGASAGAGGSGTARRPARGAAKGKGRIEEESDE